MNANSPKKRRVVVAVDGSAASLEALRVGHRMATLLGDHLVAVTAWQPFLHGILPPIAAHPQDFAEQLVANCVIAAFRGSRVPEVEVQALMGDPANMLVAVSRDASLLVMGSRGHDGLLAVLLGSVSNVCAARATCPVLIVHAQQCSPSRPAAGIPARQGLTVPN